MVSNRMIVKTRKAKEAEAAEENEEIEEDEEGGKIQVQDIAPPVLAPQQRAQTRGARREDPALSEGPSLITSFQAKPRDRDLDILDIEVNSVDIEYTEDGMPLFCRRPLGFESICKLLHGTDSAKIPTARICTRPPMFTREELRGCTFIVDTTEYKKTLGLTEYEVMTGGDLVKDGYSPWGGSHLNYKAFLNGRKVNSQDKRPSDDQEWDILAVHRSADHRQNAAHPQCAKFIKRVYYLISAEDGLQKPHKVMDGSLAAIVYEWTGLDHQPRYEIDREPSLQPRQRAKKRRTVFSVFSQSGGESYGDADTSAYSAATDASYADGAATYAAAPRPTLHPPSSVKSREERMLMIAKRRKLDAERDKLVVERRNMEIRQECLLMEKEEMQYKLAIMRHDFYNHPAAKELTEEALTEER